MTLGFFSIRSQRSGIDGESSPRRGRCSSAIGTQESKKKAIQKAACGYESTIYTVDQAEQILKTINGQAQPDRELYFHLLQVCAVERSLVVGKQVHEQLRERGIVSDVFFDNSLINMYGKCGSIAEAFQVFDEMCCRTVVSWTSMITALGRNGQYGSALRLYERMLMEGVWPNRVTFFTAIDVCARGPMPEKARMIAGHVAESVHHKDSTLGTALLNMFGKCGDMQSARAVFDGIYDKTVVTWTALITSYVNHGFFKEAFESFRKMQIKLVTPNEITFVAVLNACADSEDLERGRIYHSRAESVGLASNRLVGTALVNLYSKCGRLRDARKAFSMIIEPDVVAYNAILAGYGELGSSVEIFAVFRGMLLKGLPPTKATFVSLFNACSAPEALEQGRFIHHSFVECETDIVVRTALINMYGKCGALADAEKVFDGMVLRNLFSWNTILGVYADHKLSAQAFRLYQRMQHWGVKPDGITFMSLLNSFASTEALKLGQEVHAHLVEFGLEEDVAVANSVLDMYGKCGSLNDACLMFQRMKLRNIISWTSMITAWFQQGKDKEALLFYHRMLLEGVAPDRLTVATVLNACANFPSLKDGKALHGLVRQTGMKLELSLGTALVNMYGKSGHLAEAQAAFDSMIERDEACWNSIAAAYAQHGHAAEAVSTFRLMQQEAVDPDAISFVIVLSACRHAGFLVEGLEIFASMREGYGVEASAEHCCSVIDLLGRTGHLDEAEKYVEALKQQSSTAWTSFLDACRVHGDLERATRAAECCLSLVDDPPTFVTLSNVYAEAGN